MNQKMKRKKLPKILRTGSSTTSQNPKPVKTEHMAPFRHWLSQFQPFVWDKTMETTFRKSKERNIELIVKGIASFDKDLVTCLSPDYSKQGMGWILLQKTCACPEVVHTCCADGWRLVLAGGHFCNQAEQKTLP